MGETVYSFRLRSTPSLLSNADRNLFDRIRGEAVYFFLFDCPLIRIF
ncbi:MAG: hypothetical protein ACE5JX_05420 [Acidobacteriota bacterium]